MKRTPAAALAATAVLAALALSACGPDQIGAAAVVGDRRVSLGSEQAAVTDLRSVNKDVSEADAHRAVISEMVQLRVTEEAAARRGIAPDQGAARSFLASVVNQLGGQQKFEVALAATENEQFVGPRSASQWALRQVLTSKLAESLVPGDGADPAVAQRRRVEVARYLSSVAKRMHIQINPRYGVLASNFKVTALRSGGLAKPERSATASAQPSAPPGG